MKHASLFSGVGGFDLAAEWMNWQNIFSCEYMPFPQSILKHYFSSSQHYGDIRELDGTKYRGTIDVLTGGFPCQPFSAAGRRRGTEDNRFLWPEMLRVIREIQPTWIVAENVRGILSIEGGLVFERVCSELEEAGYEVQPICIPACAVGAPHRRERIWFIAHAKSERGGDECKNIQKENGRSSEQLSKSPRTTEQSSADSQNEQRERSECCGSSSRQPEVSIGNGNSHATDSEQSGLERKKESIEGREEHQRHNRDCVRNGLESSGRAWHEPWLQAATRLCRVDDGLPRELHGITVPRWRKESLKAYGNAIVPQIAYQIFQAIELASQ